MGTTSQADFLKEWLKLVTMVSANADELASLEGHRAQLAVEVEGLQEALARQSTHKAEFQQATRDLEGHIARGRDLATRMRDGIRMTYGRKGEKLAAFGLQPLRAPARSKDTKEAQASDVPTEPGPRPAQAAAPVTDSSI